MAATPLEVRPVSVPGWGDMHVRELTIDAVDRLNRAKRSSGDDVNALALSAAASICDEHGALLFDVGSAEDIALLSSQGFGRLSLVLKAANALAGRDEGEGASEGKA
jgi:hypothetical protein